MCKSKKMILQVNVCCGDTRGLSEKPTGGVMRDERSSDTSHTCIDTVHILFLKWFTFCFVLLLLFYFVFASETGCLCLALAVLEL